VKNKKVVLYAPERFRIENSEIEQKNIIVKPTYLSVCNADIRYYLGDRPPEILKKKLPLVLIHEAVGEIIYSDDKDFCVGDNVAVVPISKDISPLTNDYNYDYHGSKFMSSSRDGCMQSYLQLGRENLVKFTKTRPEYATAVEVASVAMQAVKRLQKYNFIENEKIAIWGTGSVAFWMSLILKAILPKTHITVIGRSPKKIDAFSFVDRTVLLENLVVKEEYDLIIEAVGGYETEGVLEKAIKMVKPVGCILLLGVSENAIAVKTREWMEKGILILTSHRSTFDDFVNVVNLIETSPIVQQNIHKGISRIVDVFHLDDIHEAISTSKVHQFKTVMRWNLQR
jgi:ribitol-5-phosphate 2-dehydrogenase